MTFQEALEAMKVGDAVRREGWLDDAGVLYLRHDLRSSFGNRPFLTMWSERHGRSPWTPYWHDFEALDWYSVEAHLLPADLRSA